MFISIIYLQTYFQVISSSVIQLINNIIVFNIHCDSPQIQSTSYKVLVTEINFIQ